MKMWATAARPWSMLVAASDGKPFSPFPDLQVEYRDAGHILGSATITLTVREGDRTVTLGFTGDVGRSDRPILRDPRAMADCDWLITESTYGGLVHEPASRTKERLAEVVGATARNNFV